MSNKGKNPYDELIIFKVSDILKGNQLSEKIFGKKDYGPYLFLLIFLSIEQIFWSVSYFYKHGEMGFDISIYSIRLFGLGIGIFFIKILSDKYKFIKKIKGIDGKEFKNILPNKYKYLFFILGIITLLGYQYSNFYDRIAGVGTINYFITCFLVQIYSVPIMSEFLSIIIGVHIYFPFKFVKNRPNLDYSDPHKNAGLEPIGNLISKSTEIYFVCLFLLTLEGIYYYLLYEKFSGITIGNFSFYFFLGAWIFGLILFIAPLMWIHNYVKSKKKDKINEVYEELKNLGDDIYCYPDISTEDPNEMVQHLHVYHKLEIVNSQSEYPIDIDKIKNVVTIAIIPLIIEIIFNYKFILGIT